MRRCRYTNHMTLCKYCQLLPPSKPRGMYCSKTCSNKARAKSLACRFRECYIPGQPTECWLWTGTLDKDGYGVIQDANRGHQFRAHRLAYELAHGPTPNGVCVLHRCDTPACCNPSHLWLGTQTDNGRDKVTKKRHPFGERHGRAKITDKDVRTIRASYPAMSQTAIAAAYGLHQTTVSDIIHGILWPHVKG